MDRLYSGDMASGDEGDSVRRLAIRPSNGFEACLKESVVGERRLVALSRCWEEKTEAVGLWALREASEVYDDRVEMAGGGPFSVSTPWLDREAGARRTDDEAEEALLSKLSSGRSGEDGVELVAEAELIRRDCVLCDRSGRVGDLRMVWYCSRSFLSDRASAKMAILGMGGSKAGGVVATADDGAVLGRE